MKYEIDDIAKTVFKIPQLREQQRRIIKEIVSGFDKEKSSMIVVLPTGGGKSLCFQLPATIASGITIIIYPILALIRDQSASLSKAGISHCVLTSLSNKKKVLLDIMSNKVKILITSMESLSNPLVLSFLSTLKISLVVFDEAHTVISWGESFRPKYLEAKSVLKHLNAHQVLAFTATLDNYTESKLCDLLFLTKPKIIASSMNRENIIYHRVRALFPIMDIVSILKEDNTRPAIVFTRSRKRCEQLAIMLSPYFKTMFYHAGLSSNQRLEIEKQFYKSSSTVMCATIAYGMGVDKRDIKTVIHYDLSETASDYLQESGRAGRDGSISHAYALIKDDEESPLKKVFLSNNCIRKSLINLMGKDLEGECQGCDSCNNIFSTAWGENQILRLIKHYPFIFKKYSLIEHLSRKKEFRGITKIEIEKAISILIKEKKIKVIFSRYY